MTVALLALVAFLSLTLFVLPVLAVITNRKLEEGAPLPPRHLFYLQTIALQGVLLGLALLVVSSLHLALLQPGGVATRDLLAGTAALGCAFVILRSWWRFGSPGLKQRLLEFLPHTHVERALWVVVSAAAAVGEEVVYRGLLFGLLLEFSGSWWLAALGSALAFALAHMVQGWRSAIVVAIFAIGLQLLVRLTGGLLVAIAVHFAYDLLVGLLLGLLGRDPFRQQVPAG